MSDAGLTVAVTGPTGTFGFGLIPLLEADPRIERVVGIARRPFDPSEHGWSKMEYRRGDVRDPDALREAFADADVVVHLAFMITGTASRETIRDDQRRGNAERVRGRGRRRRRRPLRLRLVGRRLRLPSRQPDRDDRGVARAPGRPACSTPRRRPSSSSCCASRPTPTRVSRCICSARRSSSDRMPWARRTRCPSRSRRLAQRSARLRQPAPRADPGPALPICPMQFIHEEDVGQALLKCVVADGTAGRVQHRRRRHRHRRRRRPRARPHAAADPGRARQRRGARRGTDSASVIRPARRRVGRGGEPPRDHGHDQGQARARLGPGVHRPRGPPRDPEALVGRPRARPTRRPRRRAGCRPSRSRCPARACARRTSPDRDRRSSGRRSPARPARAAAEAGRRPVRTGCSSRRGTADRPRRTSRSVVSASPIRSSTRSSSPASARFRRAAASLVRARSRS